MSTPSQIPGQITFRVAKPKQKTNNTHTAPTTKHRIGGKHQVGACCSCKAKKKKCDGAYPVCGGCVSSGNECTVVDLASSRIIPRDYIEQLEQQVQSLKEEVSRIGSSNTAKTRLANRRDLEMDIGYITLGVGSESNGFIGDSSAYSIARAVTTTISYYNKKDTSSGPESSSTIPSQQPALPSETMSIPFTMPSHEMAKNYLASYNDNVHCQYPFLDWDQTCSSFDAFLAGHGNDEDSFLGFMIFAIGSQTYNNYSPSSNIYTKMYYDKAMEHIHPLVETTSLKTVQAYLLLSVFSQKMPDASSIWQTIGLAIRTSVILGLHRGSYRRHNVDGIPASAECELKRRIFWSAYGLERINGIVLGRPFGISDIDIDVELPTDTPELGVSNHVIKLRRILSSIHTFVYTPFGGRIDDVDDTRVQIILELNNWMSTFPSKLMASSAFETKNWAEISYHNSLVLLLRPVVLEVASSSKESPPSRRSLEWFKVFTQSTSVICMNYKELHSKGKLSYTWLAMHCVFVAGLSFLYCIWIDTSTSFNVLELKRESLIYDTVRSCSSILYVFAEKFKKAVVFRNTFERISNTVLYKLEKTKATNTDIPKYSSSCALPGVLEKDSIGIDQYLDYDPNLLWELSSEEQDSSQKHTSPSNFDNSNDFAHPRKTQPSPIDSTFWEFLDTTGDRFTRDIFRDMELSFT